MTEDSATMPRGGVVRHYSAVCRPAPGDGVVARLEGNPAPVAATVGLFSESASAASIAGVIESGHGACFEKGSRIVCTLTGHGLKDPDNAIAKSVAPAAMPATTGDAARVPGF